MAINESLGSPLYFAYKNAGPALGLILPAILLNVITLSGVVMNVFVVFVTIRTKSLHGTTNFLLALISFCEVLHQSGHAIFLVIVVIGVNFVDIVSAVFMELPMFFGLNASLMAMALAALDRLFAVIAPNFHKTMKKKIYLILLTICCIIYGLYWDYFMLCYANENAGTPVTALISDVMSNVFFTYTTVLNGISIVAYVLVCILIRCKSGVTKQTNSRLLKSLLVIVLINIGGYLISLSFYQLILYLQETMDYILIWRLAFIPGCALNIGAACNAPVLYFTSTEYRKAFAYHLARLHFPCFRTTQIHHHTKVNGTLFVVQQGGAAIASPNSKTFVKPAGMRNSQPETITMPQISMAGNT